MKIRKYIAPCLDLTFIGPKCPNKLIPMDRQPFKPYKKALCMPFIVIIIRGNNIKKQGIIKMKETTDQSTGLKQGILKGKLANVCFKSK